MANSSGSLKKDTGDNLPVTAPFNINQMFYLLSCSTHKIKSHKFIQHLNRLPLFICGAESVRVMNGNLVACVYCVGKRDGRRPTPSSNIQP